MKSNTNGIYFDGFQKEEQKCLKSTTERSLSTIPQCTWMVIHRIKFSMLSGVE